METRFDLTKHSGIDLYVEHGLPECIPTPRRIVEKTFVLCANDNNETAPVPHEVLVSSQLSPHDLELWREPVSSISAKSTPCERDGRKGNIVERVWMVMVLPRRVIYAEKHEMKGRSGWMIFGDERWGTLWIDGTGTWGKRWWKVEEGRPKLLVYDRDKGGFQTQI